MTDNHIHIGQYREIYYDPLEIIDIAMSSGITGVAFSSTSSCIKNIKYSEVEKEIQQLLSQTSYSSDTIKPYLWYVPDYIHQDVTLESAFSEVPYKGIKIHPYAQIWDFDNKQHGDALHSLFDFAGQNNIPVLIHTGHSGVDSANRFESFIKSYRQTQCILAHCRPLDTIIKMLQNHSNVYCDTAFVEKADVRQLVDLGFRERIVFGSDFPITHYFKTYYPRSVEASRLSLKDQYAEDISGWESLLSGLSK